MIVPGHTPLNPFERRLKHRHNLPDHWVRTINALRNVHR